MPRTNRATQQDRDRKMIAAIQKYLMSIASILIRGAGYTPAQLVAMLQNDIAAADAATRANAALHDAVAAAKAQRATMNPVLTGFRTYILNQFQDASTISDFGFAPQKVPTRLVADKAAAATKAKATRTARHTMGSRQKKGVKGNVVGVTVTASPVAAAGASGTSGAGGLSGPSAGTSTVPVATTPTAAGTTTAPHAT